MTIDSTNGQTSPRILILDSYPLFARGARELLSRHGFRVDIATTAATLFTQIWRADVLLVDPDAVRGESIERFVANTVPDTPVLLVVTSARGKVPIPASCSHIDRTAPESILVDAVRTVASGQRFGAPGGADPPVPAGSELLSRREREVLRHIAHGRTHGQIARALGISRHTVDTYVKRIRSKLGLGNKAELTRAAVLGGFVARPLLTS